MSNLRLKTLFGLSPFFASFALANSAEIPNDLTVISIIQSAQVVRIESFCDERDVCNADSVKKIVHLRFPLKSCVNSLGPVSAQWSTHSSAVTEATLQVRAQEYETERARTTRCLKAATADLLIEAPSRHLEKVDLQVLKL